MPKLSKTKYLILIDVLLLVASVLLAIYVLPKGKQRLIDWGWQGISISAVLWIGISYACRKYRVRKSKRWRLSLVFCNILIVLLLMGISYWDEGDFFFRDGTYFIFLLVTAVELTFFKGVEEVSTAADMSRAERYFKERTIRRRAAKARELAAEASPVKTQNVYEAIKEERGKAVADYIASIEPLGGERVCVLATHNTFQLKTFGDGQASSVVNIRRLNNKHHLIAFLQLVNNKLEDGGHLLCCLEIKNTRKQRILSRYPKGINWCCYTIDYIFKRVFPKLRATRGLYFFLTKGYNRILTYTEMLGRFYACGFELISQQQIGDLHYFQLRKVSDFDDFELKNYGMMIKLPRVGKHGHIIKVYKMRTMHPYSEYLQAYLYDNNGTHTGDKLKDDFRVNYAGAFFRKFWLDELPMLLNLIKGDLKIVGVRPLSQHKYNTYPKALQEKRIKTKPGLVPPYYADMPKSEKEMWETENRYLDAYLKHPIRTDWIYFWKAVYNIVIKGERSA